MPHINLSTHSLLSSIVDQPISAMLNDLNQSGMRKEIRLVWTTGFGHASFSNTVDANGRKIHPREFGYWLVSVSVTPENIHGATDDISIRVQGESIHVHNFHGTSGGWIMRS